jgi:hypothetical protein
MMAENLDVVALLGSISDTTVSVEDHLPGGGYNEGWTATAAASLHGADANLRNE